MIRLPVLNNSNLNRFILLLSAVVLLFMFKHRFYSTDGEAYKRVIDGDGKGYYAYLPAVLIYHDLTFSFFEKDPAKFGYKYASTFLLNHDKKNLNKYTCGEALLLLPFFLLAMLYCWFMGLPVDGYNSIFQVFAALGTMFYFIAGLYFTKKVLQQYFLSAISIALALLGIALGSNLLNYTVNESPMSHVYSFCAIAVNVYLVKKYFTHPSLKTILLAGIVLGLIILIRPINGIVVFSYPFLAGDNEFFKKVKNNFSHFFMAGCMAAVVMFIQLLFWKLETGSFLVYGYKNEGFYFSKMPPAIDYVFGFKRGAFIYSPVLFLSLIGLWKMFRQKLSALWLLFFLILVVYIHASWWSWYYGDGFGERPLIDFYVFFALLIGFAFSESAKKIIRYSMYATLFVFILLHQVFFYQYLKAIIHPYSMDFEKFCHVFLKTSDKYKDLYKCETEDFYHPRGVLVTDSISHTLTDTNSIPGKKLYFAKKDIKPGNYYEVTEAYPLTYEITTDASWLFKPRYAEISFDYLQPQPDSAASSMVVYVTMSTPDNSVSNYNSNRLAGRVFNTTGEWMHNLERIQIGIAEKTGITIRVFLDNQKRKRIFIKNLCIKIVEAKP